MRKGTIVATSDLRDEVIRGLGHLSAPLACLLGNSHKVGCSKGGGGDRLIMEQSNDRKGMAGRAH